jgi:hypothetical protein
MGIAEFIIGPAEGRTRWLHPSYVLLPRQADAVRKVSALGSGGADWDELVNDPNLLFDDIISRAPARSRLRSKAAPSIESAERIWRAKPVAC